MLFVLENGDRKSFTGEVRLKRTRTKKGKEAIAKAKGEQLPSIKGKQTPW
jgi:hypothetical protein